MKVSEKQSSLMGHIMSNSPLISVIMNCYNGQRYLKEAIDSVVSQTYLHWELIFWDNQSTDNSASIVRSYSDARIRYFYSDNHTNLGAARNLALMKARGNWVGFLDVDDLWFSEKLEIQVENISKGEDNVGLFYSRCEVFHEVVNSGTVDRNKRIFPSSNTLPQEDISDELFVGNFIPFPSILYKKDALETIGGVPAYKYTPDYFMSLAISLKWRVVALDNVLCAYRLHQNNLSLRLKECGYRESIELIHTLAPRNKVKRMETYHRSRLIVYLIVQKRWYDALQEFCILGVVGLLVGLIGIYRQRSKHYH